MLVAIAVSVGAVSANGGVHETSRRSIESDNRSMAPAGLRPWDGDVGVAGSGLSLGGAAGSAGADSDAGVADEADSTLSGAESAPPTGDVEDSRRMDAGASAEGQALDGIEAIICSYVWPCGEALAVAACESGHGTDGRLDGAWAVGGSSYGVFQINAIHAYRWPDFWEAWMIAERNVAWAYELWAEQGWRPWSCRP